VQQHMNVWQLLVLQNTQYDQHPWLNTLVHSQPQRRKALGCLAAVTVLSLLRDAHTHTHLVVETHTHNTDRQGSLVATMC
jgi:hypothetical protein